LPGTSQPGTLPSAFSTWPKSRCRRDGSTSSRYSTNARAEKRRRDSVTSSGEPGSTNHKCRAQPSALLMKVANDVRTFALAELRPGTGNRDKFRRRRPSRTPCDFCRALSRYMLRLTARGHNAHRREQRHDRSGISRIATDRACPTRAFDFPHCDLRNCGLLNLLLSRARLAS
jgi:hypothetical protein